MLESEVNTHAYNSACDYIALITELVVNSEQLA